MDQVTMTPFHVLGRGLVQSTPLFGWLSLCCNFAFNAFYESLYYGGLEFDKNSWAFQAPRSFISPDLNIKQNLRSSV